MNTRNWISPWRSFVLAGACAAQMVHGAELLPPGHLPKPLSVHALVGGTVVTAPGSTLSNATVVLRAGRIEAVGVDLQPPEDARIWNVKGMTLYAGFIDLYASTGRSSDGGQEREHGLDSDRSGLSRFFGVPGDEVDRGNTGPGYPNSRIRPERRAVHELALDPKMKQALRELGFTAANVVPDSGIIRGQSCLVQLKDAAPEELVLVPALYQHVSVAGAPGSGYPASSMGVAAAIRQAFLDAMHYRDTDVAQRMFNPALESLSVALQGGQFVMMEYRAALLAGIAASVRDEFDLKCVFLAGGQEWRRLDLIEKIGGAFVVPLNFPEAPRSLKDADWEDVSLDQLRVWDWAPENPAVLRRAGIEISLTTAGLSDRSKFRKNLKSALSRGLSEEDALAALTTVPARLAGIEKEMGTIEPGKAAHLVVVEGNYFEPETKVRVVWVGGDPHPISRPEKEPKKEEKTRPGQTIAEWLKEKARKEEPVSRIARSPLEGRGPVASPKSVLVRDAAIWTCGPEGLIEKGWVRIEGGVIAGVGSGDPPNAEAELVIEAGGRHVTPGLIDAHSHAMVLGGVNEGTVPSSAMVRIADVVNSETDNIHQQLGGGVTVANLLHGSANPIGGQNCVIKLRDGELPSGLIMKEAPPGIKFALGENVKQSSRPQGTTRFPQSRMGVRSFFENRFVAARQYAANRGGKENGAAVRRDLELEALAEVIEGKRWIHSHAYRQDEMLMLIDLMEEFGVKIATFQHALEGYKIAAEIAAHGAGASIFTDWWAYKVEAYDAIPYAASIMHDRGVLVSFNSDDADLARRLNMEAAKAVKYGRVSEEEALKFVTINPAKQLRIEQWVGSLEPGKQADFAIWSNSPLDSLSVCEETWIDGRKYFDRSFASARAFAREKEREALVRRARGKASGKAEPDPAAEARFFEVAMEQQSGGYHCEVDHE